MRFYFTAEDRQRQARSLNKYLLLHDYPKYAIMIGPTRVT